MADFDVKVASGIGAGPVTWADPKRDANFAGTTDPAAPSRLNPHSDLPHKMRRGTVGTQIELQALLPGETTPQMDTGLGGRLFSAWVAENPGPPISFSSPAGQSAVQRFTPVAVGHHTIGIQRTDGGAVLVHVDVA